MANETIKDIVLVLENDKEISDILVGLVANFPALSVLLLNTGDATSSIKLAQAIDTRKIAFAVVNYKQWGVVNSISTLNMLKQLNIPFGIINSYPNESGSLGDNGALWSVLIEDRLRADKPKLEYVLAFVFKLPALLHEDKQNPV